MSEETGLPEDIRIDLGTDCGLSSNEQMAYWSNVSLDVSRAPSLLESLGVFVKNTDI